MRNLLILMLPGCGKCICGYFSAYNADDAHEQHKKDKEKATSAGWN